MEFVNASEAKREFGELLLKAQHGPVGINKNGKPVAVVLSTAEYEQLQAIKEERLKGLIQEGVADIRAGKVAKGEEVLSRLRNRLQS